jgi:CheY-like chemotaxis protein
MAEPPSSRRTRQPRLLLVDDNKLNMTLLKMFVKKHGYDNKLIATAEDGQQAVDYYRAEAREGRPPDVIFMDLSMPVMDGYEATRAIRRLEGRSEGMCTKDRPKRALIAALTGNAGVSDRAAAFDAGFDLFITKPYSFENIGTLLDKWRE